MPEFGGSFSIEEIKDCSMHKVDCADNDLVVYICPSESIAIKVTFIRGIYTRNFQKMRIVPKIPKIISRNFGRL